MIRRTVTRRDVVRIFAFGGILVGLGLLGFRSKKDTRSEMDTSMGVGAPGLSPELVEAIKLRIQDPRRRSTVRPGEPVAVVTEPGQLEKLFASQGPEAVAALRAVNEQREQWGQQMPPMYVTQNDNGTLAASSEDPNNYPLALPAAEAAFDQLERSIGRALPQDLRQLYLIADGGFGPGLGYTPGFGPGLYSLERIGQELDDLRRRGPDYTGRTAWPSHLLPLTDNFGPVSYDLERGVIVAFNEYYEDEGLTVDEAFSDLHPNLEEWLWNLLSATP